MAVQTQSLMIEMFDLILNFGTILQNSRIQDELLVVPSTHRSIDKQKQLIQLLNISLEPLQLLDKQVGKYS
jgi:hypothetical protein